MCLLHVLYASMPYVIPTLRGVARKWCPVRVSVYCRHEIIKKGCTRNEWDLYLNIFMNTNSTLYKRGWNEWLETDNQSSGAQATKLSKKKEKEGNLFIWTRIRQIQRRGNDIVAHRHKVQKDEETKHWCRLNSSKNCRVSRKRAGDNDESPRYNPWTRCKRLGINRSERSLM